MPPLYKYVTEERFAAALREQGQVYMQTLAAFRVYEDNDVRGDRHDGRLQYEPSEGLLLTRSSGEIVRLPMGWKMASSPQADDIYVYCLSTVRSEELAERFNSPFCVEIQNPIGLIGRIKRSVALRSQLARGHVFHGPVEYRQQETQPIVKWALPEQVSFIKPPAWQWQSEYRIVVGRKGAFDVENVVTTLECGEAANMAPPQRRPLTLAVGSILQGTIVHKF
jgi:hypothetical protein